MADQAAETDALLANARGDWVVAEQARMALEAGATLNMTHHDLTQRAASHLPLLHDQVLRLALLEAAVRSAVARDVPLPPSIVAALP